MLTDNCKPRGLSEIKQLHPLAFDLRNIERIPHQRVNKVIKYKEDEAMKQT